MTASRTPRILFATWDGPQTSYLEGLFLPIFERLRTAGHEVDVMQFTWGPEEHRAAQRRACEARGIAYTAQTVLRHPSRVAKALSTAMGAAAIRRLVAARRIDLVLPRSTLPAFAAWRACRRMGTARPAILFDADGLPHDERVDFTGWSPHGMTYRLLRDLEAEAVRRADAVLVRSARAAEILAARAGPCAPPPVFHAVWNGRDTERFRPASAEARAETRRRLGIAADAFLLVYAGSMGAQYCPGEMVALFRAVRDRRPDAHFLVLTGETETAEREIVAPLDMPRCVTVMRAAPDEMPALLGAADAGLALRRPGFSMQAVFPIKVAEYLLCGLPVVATRGIGDLDGFLEGAQSVHRTDNLNDAALAAAAEWLVEPNHVTARTRAEEARRLGLAHCGLDATVARYTAAIEAALAARAGRPASG